MSTHWGKKRLSEIADYFIGLTYSPKDVSTDGIVVLRSSNIQDGRLEFNDVVRVNKRVKDELMVKKGDILMCARNGSKRLVGKTAVIRETEEGMTFGTFMMIIRSNFNPFLSWFFISDEFRKQITGGENTAISQITRYMLDDVEVPFPPISEQKSIVKLLEEALREIEKAKANIERNLENAKELYESYFTYLLQTSLRSAETKSLIEVCEIFVDSPHRTPKYQMNGIPALRPRDVVNGELNLSSAARVSPDEYKIQTKRYQPQPGDIVYSRELSYGWASLLPKSPDVCLSQGMCLFRPSPLVRTSFLLFMLNGPIGRNQAHQKAVGAAHPHINLSDIKKYSFPIPKIDQQNEIVRQLNGIAEEINRLNFMYRKKLENLQMLKKSILHKAFSGELTAATKNLVT